MHCAPRLTWPVCRAIRAGGLRPAAKLETTALYTRVAVNTIRDIKSPLERLGLNLASRKPPA